MAFPRYDDFNSPIFFPILGGGSVKRPKFRITRCRKPRRVQSALIDHETNHRSGPGGRKFPVRWIYFSFRLGIVGVPLHQYFEGQLFHYQCNAEQKRPDPFFHFGRTGPEKRSTYDIQNDTPLCYFNFDNILHTAFVDNILNVLRNLLERLLYPKFSLNNFLFCQYSGTESILDRLNRLIELARIGTRNTDQEDKEGQKKGHHVPKGHEPFICPSRFFLWGIGQGLTSLRALFPFEHFLKMLDPLFGPQMRIKALLNDARVRSFLDHENTLDDDPNLEHFGFGPAR